MQILMVGCGNMGAALARNWDADTLTIISPNGVRDAALQASDITVYQQPAQLPATYQPDIILFAVKPQQIPAVLPLYQPLITRYQPLVISIAAGISLATLKHLSRGQVIVRAMPNMPAAIGEGITTLVSDTTITKMQHTATTSLFSANGHVVWLDDENLMDAATAIAGSGAAYLYYFTECLSMAGEHLGLSPVLAQELARQTIIGAAAMLKYQPDTTPEELRRAVTSPAGTTAAAMSVLSAPAGLAHLLHQATAAATQRAGQLRAETTSAS